MSTNSFYIRDEAHIRDRSVTDIPSTGDIVDRHASHIGDRFIAARQTCLRKDSSETDMPHKCSISHALYKHR